MVRSRAALRIQCNSLPLGRCRRYRQVTNVTSCTPHPDMEATATVSVARLLPPAAAAAALGDVLCTS